MADKHTETIKSRLRKSRANQAENETTVTKCSSANNTHIGSFHIPSTASITEKISTIDSINVEIIDTPFDRDNIIIQVTNQHPIQTQNPWIQGTSSHPYSRQEARKQNGLFEECTIGSSRNKDDLGFSSKLKDTAKDPSWSLFGDKQDDSAANKTITKHGRGAKQVDLDRIEDAEQKRNIERSRNYRVEKKYEDQQVLTELESLEARNKDLQEKERKLSDTVKRSKDTYIDLIKEGRIKFQ